MRWKCPVEKCDWRNPFGYCTIDDQEHCKDLARWLGHQEGRVERDAEVLALIDDAMRGFGRQEKADALLALRKAIKGVL